MRAFVLAAGLGTRLRPLTDTLPKPLVPIAGEPLILRTIRQLAAAGVVDVGVNLFHLADSIRDRIGDGSALGVRITWFDERPAVLGTGGGLKHAEAFLRAGQGPFVLCNADVWHGFDLRGVIASHRTDSLATMAVHRTPRRPELHTVACHRDGRIVHIGGRPSPAPAGDFTAIYTGVAVYDPRLLDWLPAGKVSGLVSHGLLPAMEHGEPVRWVEPEGAWFDCGTHAEVLRASAWALRERAERGAVVRPWAMARVA